MSSISGINLNSSSIPIAGTSGANLFRQDLKTLQTSLQTGDLSGTQSALTSLSSSLQSSASGSAAVSSTCSNTCGSSLVKDDLQSIPLPLQSSDINSAKTAFAKRKTDLHDVGGHHHRGSKPATSKDVNSLLDSLLSAFNSPSSTTASSSQSAVTAVANTSVGNVIN